jgi:small-conductance mechanosensitive channel
MNPGSLLLAAALLAQDPPPDTAVLYAGPRPIFVMRAPIGAQSPHDRAAAAGQRLRRAFRAGLDSVAVESTGVGSLVLLDGTPVFVVLTEDADTAGGGTLEATTARAVHELRRAVAEHREARTVPTLLKATALSVAATLLFILLLRLLIRTRQRIAAWLDRTVTRKLGDVRVGTLTLLDHTQMRAVERVVVTLAAWAAGLLLTYAWVTFVLKRFPWTRHWGEALGAFLAGTVLQLLSGLVRQLPGLFIAILIFAAVRLAARGVSAVFERVERGTILLPGVHPDTARPTQRLLVALLWLFGLVVAFPFIPGSDTEAFRGISVFAGLLLTLGSSGVVGQAMSGMVLMYARALREGDYVRIGEIEGTVTEVGMLSTKVRTPKLEEITIPSGVVLGTNVRNFTRLKEGTGTIIGTTVTIGYDAPWRQVHAMMLEAARLTPGFRTVPPPYVRQRALGDFYVEYEVCVYTDTPERRVALLSDLHANIQDQFNAHGVQIMSPHYEGDPAQAKLVPKERWHAPPATPAVDAGTSSS